jgi:hypothetical protein
MLILIFASLSTSIQSPLVNCDPWTVLNIYGVPCFANASFSASMQNAVSMLFESRQTDLAMFSNES